MRRVLPGRTIGIIGGGQLARMMAWEARRMGYRVRVMDPEPECPAARVSEAVVSGSFDDVEAALRLADGSDVVTLDTEHVPAGLLEEVERVAPVLPSPGVMRRVQDRYEQRRFLDTTDVPHARWAPVSSHDDLQPASGTTGLPCIVKSRTAGYDGKGQARADRSGDLAGAWESIGRVPAVMEQFVDFEKEVSVLLARGHDGEVRFYPLAENVHRNHVLFTTTAPADIPAEVGSRARDIAGGIASSLGHVGMMAIEMFLTREGGLLVNEIAPRTHNSGHYTFGTCVTSQFEQHVRAVCGLPLGDTTQLRPAVMVNLLGDLWARGEPDWDAVLRHPEARLHLYDKKRAVPGRKMGHVLVAGEDVGRARGVVDEIVTALS